MKPNIQFLKHGDVISKTNTPTFVETWNYLINRSQNLKGDGDSNGEEGFISVDNSNEEFPTVRLDIQKLKNKLGGGEGAEDFAPFKIVDGKMINCYVQEEQFIRMVDDGEKELDDDWAGFFVWVQLTYSSSGKTYSYNFGDLDSYNQMAALCDTYSIAPLYKFDSDMNVEIDLRKIPHMQLWAAWNDVSGGSLQ